MYSSFFLYFFNKIRSKNLSKKKNFEIKETEEIEETEREKFLFLI